MYVIDAPVVLSQRPPGSTGTWGESDLHTALTPTLTLSLSTLILPWSQRQRPP